MLNIRDSQMSCPFFALRIYDVTMGKGMNGIFSNRRTPSLGTMKATRQIMLHQFNHYHLIYLQIDKIFEFEFLKKMVSLYRNMSCFLLHLLV